MRYHSPLRYPGGKSKISRFMKRVIELCLLVDGEYVEPYAGGASVALDLLMNEYVRRVHINDIDKAIHAFWFSVLNHTEELCQLIWDTPVTLQQWQANKMIFQNQEEQPALKLGFSTFFLNRTNRSGILKGGVIGGQNQNGKWKLDARYNKRDLIYRIQQIALYGARIELTNMDAVEYLSQAAKRLPNKTLYYLDPPYYRKGKELYLNYYSHDDHVWIAKQVKRMSDLFWIVSYDNVPEIRNIYNGFEQFTYDISYSASSPTQGKEVMIVSNTLCNSLLGPSTIVDQMKNQSSIRHFCPAN
ncbi:MAG: DNA adenine methylase [Halobacteriota archaeon]|nr:DNA adenine methylase [Halobacteriota archaeon]